jgi:aspartyl-tRNA(Asn)/glutamyl-tRNA(Gln) amidotransferase subunit C
MHMLISNDVILQTAALARLVLNPNQVEKTAKDLNKIIEYVNRISTVDTSNVKINADSGIARNVFREDTVNPSLPVKEVLKNAPEEKDGHIIVPRVI